MKKVRFFPVFIFCMIAGNSFAQGPHAMNTVSSGASYSNSSNANSYNNSSADYNSSASNTYNYSSSGAPTHTESSVQPTYYQPAPTYSAPTYATLPANNSYVNHGATNNINYVNSSAVATGVHPQKNEFRKIIPASSSTYSYSAKTSYYTPCTDASKNSWKCELEKKRSRDAKRM